MPLVEQRTLSYVAGPFRGPNAWEVEKNIRKAEEVGFYLAGLGRIPLIPHTMYRFWDGTLDDSFWLAAGIRLLRQCNEIVMRPGWDGSAGSMAELREAEKLGLPAYMYRPAIPGAPECLIELPF